MRLGIIGSGVIVQEFLLHLVNIDNLDIIAIQGTQRSKDKTDELCKKYNIEYSLCDIDELLTLDIDTVYIATPNNLHYSQTIKALNSGKNVIVEKPIASNIEETLEMVNLAKEKGRFLYEDITTIYFEAYKKIEEWLKEIGDIRIIKFNYSQYSRRYDRFKSGEILPAFSLDNSGGALMDLNIYNVYLLIALFGEPKEVKYYPNIYRDIDTSGTLIMNYDGFVADATACKDCAGPFSFVIEGDKGYISIGFPPNVMGKVSLHLNDGTTKEYVDEYSSKRVIPEFMHFIKEIEVNNVEDSFNKMELALKVSKTITKARKDAGIIFPSDK